MSHPWGTTNTNDRGSAETRRRRKQWLLDEFGDGYTAPCCFCGIELDYFTISCDRHPIAGVDGGRYVRGNIRPACTTCNASDGSIRRWQRQRTTRV